MKKGKPHVLCCQSRFDYEDKRFTIDYIPIIELHSLEFDNRIIDEQYDWIIFTSKNAVELFSSDLEHMDVTHIASIGSKTTEVLHEFGFQVDFESDTFTQEGFIEKFPVEPGMRILYPASTARRRGLEKYLRDSRVELAVVELYKPVTNHASIEYFLKYLDRSDAITFSSPSGVTGIIENLPKEALHKFHDKLVISIGPVTHNALKKFGVESIYPNIHTTEAMFELISEKLEV